MSPRARIILASACTTYLSLGIAGATMGPLLPELAGRTGIPLSGAGLILSFYFLGGAAARLVAGIFSDRYGPVPIVLGGLIVEACSGLVLTLSRAPALLYVSSFFLGVALGSGLLGAVLIAAKLNPTRSVALVNLVNAFWGIGSFVGPALYSAISASTHTGLPVIWIAGVIALTAIPLLLGGVRGSGLSEEIGFLAPRHRGEAGSGGQLRAGVLRAPAFWLFGLILLFDVGTESTLGGWTAVYMHRSAPVSLQLAALVVSGFYVFFALGRVIAAAVGSRTSASRVLSSALLLALAGVGLAAATPGRLAPSVAGFLLAGLGIGPIYPTITALVTRSFGARAGTAVGLTGSLGFVGGVVFPWVAGTLMPVFGETVPVGLSELLLLIVAFLAYLTVVTTRRRQGAE